MGAPLALALLSMMVSLLYTVLTEPNKKRDFFKRLSVEMKCVCELPEAHSVDEVHQTELWSEISSWLCYVNLHQVTVCDEFDWWTC